MVSGYSQGAYSGMQFTKFLELNTDVRVRATAAGGTPANLDGVLNGAKSQEIYPFPFFLPYAYLGWSENNQITRDLSTIIQEPYATESISLFDGSNSYVDVIVSFPKNRTV